MSPTLARASAPLWLPVLALYLGGRFAWESAGEIVGELRAQAQAERDRRAHPDWFRPGTAS